MSFFLHGEKLRVSLSKESVIMKNAGFSKRAYAVGPLTRNVPLLEFQLTTCERYLRPAVYVTDTLYSCRNAAMPMN